MEPEITLDKTKWLVWQKEAWRSREQFLKNEFIIKGQKKTTTYLQKDLKSVKP